MHFLEANLLLWVGSYYDAWFGLDPLNTSVILHHNFAVAVLMVVVRRVHFAQVEVTCTGLGSRLP